MERSESDIAAGNPYAYLAWALFVFGVLAPFGGGWFLLLAGMLCLATVVMFPIVRYGVLKRPDDQRVRSAVWAAHTTVIVVTVLGVAWGALWWPSFMDAQRRAKHDRVLRLGAAIQERCEEAMHRTGALPGSLADLGLSPDVHADPFGGAGEPLRWHTIGELWLLQSRGPNGVLDNDLDERILADLLRAVRQGEEVAVALAKSEISLYSRANVPVRDGDIIIGGLVGSATASAPSGSFSHIPMLEQMATRP